MGGQPRARITQNLIMNSTAKQHRQHDLVDETPYESTARNNHSVAQKSSGAPLSRGVTGTMPRRHNLKFDEEEELVGAMREYIRLELEVDESKSRIADAPDFNLMDGFQMLDKYSKGWVTAPELIEALGDLGAYPHRDDVHLFVRRFDRDGDGRILYSDFCDAFRPFEESLAHALQRRPAYHINHGFCRTHFFSVDTRTMFLNTMRAHFAAEESAELLRKRLSRRPDFNVHEAFLALDKDSNGYLTRNELRRFMADNGVYASERDLCLLLNRFDRNLDGRVSYAEFMEEMITKCPSK